MSALKPSRNSWPVSNPPMMLHIFIRATVVKAVPLAWQVLRQWPKQLALIGNKKAPKKQCIGPVLGQTELISSIPSPIQVAAQNNHSKNPAKQWHPVCKVISACCTS